MRPFCVSFCLLLMLAVPATAAMAAGAADPAAGTLTSPTSPSSPACNVASSDPAASGEPPAWVLLASAVVLLAAGRLAGAGSR